MTPECAAEVMATMVSVADITVQEAYDRVRVELHHVLDLACPTTSTTLPWPFITLVADKLWCDIAMKRNEVFQSRADVGGLCDEWARRCLPMEAGVDVAGPMVVDRGVIDDAAAGELAPEGFLRVADYLVERQDILFQGTPGADMNEERTRLEELVSWLNRAASQLGAETPIDCLVRGGSTCASG